MSRYLAELEMKLQLMAEDVEAILANSSTRALAHIPTAVHELSHVKVAAIHMMPFHARLSMHPIQSHDRSSQ